MAKWSIDVETYSEADLRKVGAWAYAQHPSTELLCAAVAIDDLQLPGDVLTDPSTQTLPDVRPGDTIHAWNAFFEICILRRFMPRWCPPLDQWHCTAAQAATLALPRSLGAAGAALGIDQDQQKDKRGKYLIQQLCKPVRGKRNSDPDLLAELYEYCKQDVVAERAIGKRLLPMTDFEREVWLADMRINLRGVPLDMKGVENAIHVYEAEYERLMGELRFLTGVENPNSVKQLLEWLHAQGCGIESLAKDAIESELKTQGQKENLLLCSVLSKRLQLAKTPPKKYYAMRELGKADGRAHGMFRYHGAQPGRWTGQLIQMQNLPRPVIDDTDEAFDLLEYRDRDFIEMLYREPMNVLASCVRSAITATPGHTLMVGDYSSIESRALAWQAGQMDKLALYEAGGKIYESEAEAIFNLPAGSVTKEDWQRQIGKVAELALGYEGGFRAFTAMGYGYGIDMNEVVRRATSEQRIEFPDIKRFWKEFDGSELSDGEAFADYIKRQWRAKNAATCQYWRDLLEACLMAVDNPGRLVVLRREETGFHLRIKYGPKAGFLLIQLPSNRCIAYSRPYRGKDRKTERSYLGFTGTNDKGMWVRQATWGGKLAQNVTEAVCRDLLAHAIVNLERADYPVVLHVHDEAAAEVPDGHGSLEEYVAIMEDKPAWAAGLPVVVGKDAYQSKRYRK